MPAIKPHDIGRDKSNRKLLPVPKRVGYLTVLGPSKKRTARREILQRCRCDCGKTVYVAGSTLRAGKQKCCSRHCPVKSRYCAEGHDKDIVGRRPNGGCRECGRAASLRWARENKERTRYNHVKRKFGLSEAEYDQMMLAGGCEICGERTDLSVDHDHTTGKVRAILCRPCNSAIGLLDDNPELLRRAAQYLEEHR